MVEYSILTGNFIPLKRHVNNTSHVAVYCPKCFADYDRNNSSSTVFASLSPIEIALARSSYRTFAKGSFVLLKKTYLNVSKALLMQILYD